MFPIFRSLIVSVFLCLAFSTIAYPECGGREVAQYDEPGELAVHVKLETALSSLANRRGDIIQFTTLDDLKVRLTADLYKASAELNAAGTPVYKCVRVALKDELHVIVPAKTSIYGKVTSRKSRSPFWIGGKAKVYAGLANGNLESNSGAYTSDFDDPQEMENLEPCNSKSERKAWRKYRKSMQSALDKRAKLGPAAGAAVVIPTRPAEFNNIEFCIKGRRAQIDWATAILGPLVAGYQTIVDINNDDDEDEDGLNLAPALTSAAILSKASGLSDVLSGTSATIPAGMIFRLKLRKL